MARHISIPMRATIVLRGLRLLPYRVSLRPAKSLLWLWLSRDMRYSKGKSTGIDAGCGPMGNRPLFRSDHYVGIDTDAASLQAGHTRHPEATTVLSAIEDATHIHGDFVVCVQVIRINREFDVANDRLAIRALVGMCNLGGCLIVNLGSLGSSLKELESFVDGIVYKQFMQVEKRRYGAFSTKMPKMASLLLAYLMLVVPPLRTGFGQKHRNTYYLCRNKTGGVE